MGFTATEEVKFIYFLLLIAAYLLEMVAAYWGTQVNTVQRICPFHSTSGIATYRYLGHRLPVGMEPSYPA